MLKLLVIADDLTGATDTGAQFAKQGVPVLIVTDADAEWPAPGAGPSDDEVLVVNTESRHLPPAAAARRVRGVVERGAKLGVRRFYKKIDSSLRGNVGSELESLMITLGRRVLPLLPAFPALKRATKGGYQYVDDRPLHETVFARDPLEPMGESYIPAILQQQTRVPTRVVKASERSRPGAVKFDAEGIYVIDAATEPELRAAGELLKRHDLLNVTAGSAGFAACLPDLMGLTRRATDRPSARGSMLVVSGSLNEVSLNQLSRAEAAGFVALTLSPEILAAENGAQSTEARQAIAEILGAYRQGRDVILRSIEKLEDLELYRERGRRLGIAPAQLHLLITKNLGELVGQVLRPSDCRWLVVFGGDTLVAVARALGWSGLRPQAEILPGVVASRVSGAQQDPQMLLITKAGGFGSAEVLLRVKDALGRGE